MIETLTNVCEHLTGVPDLACQMMIQIANLIIACIKNFHDAIDTKAPWTRFLEGQKGFMLEFDGSSRTTSHYGDVCSNSVHAIIFHAYL